MQKAAVAKMEKKRENGNERQGQVSGPYNGYEEGDREGDVLMKRGMPIPSLCVFFEGDGGGGDVG